MQLIFICNGKVSLIVYLEVVMLYQKLEHQHSTPIKRSALEHVLSYQNHDVTSKFRKEWNVSQEEAADIFMETKKFLWLASACQDGDFSLTVHEQFHVIDEMWHTFIQHTEDYSNFCQNYLGGFIHHMPMTDSMASDVMKNANNLSISINDYQFEKYKAQINKISEILGVETAVKWYTQYAVSYSTDTLNKIRIPITSPKNNDYVNAITPYLNLPVDKLYDVLMKKELIVKCGLREDCLCDCMSTPANNQIKPVHNSLCICSPKNSVRVVTVQ
jgi:energy-converting hydrogenase A subunit M